MVLTGMRYMNRLKIRRVCAHENERFRLCGARVCLHGLKRFDLQQLAVKVQRLMARPDVGLFRDELLQRRVPAGNEMVPRESGKGMPFYGSQH